MGPHSMGTQRVAILLQILLTVGLVRAMENHQQYAYDYSTIERHPHSQLLSFNHDDQALFHESLGLYHEQPQPQPSQYQHNESTEYEDPDQY